MKGELVNCHTLFQRSYFVYFKTDQYLSVMCLKFISDQFSNVFFIVVRTPSNCTRNVQQFKRSRPQMFFKICVIKIFEIFKGNHLCCSLFLIKSKTCNFNEQETPTQVFSCENCEAFKKSIFMEHLWWPLLVVNSPSICIFSSNTKYYERSIIGNNF